MDPFDVRVGARRTGASSSARGALGCAAVMTVFFCYATVYVCCFGDGLESDFLADRKEKKRRRKADEDDDP